MNKEKITNYAIRTKINYVWQDNAYDFLPKNKFEKWVINFLLKKKIIKHHFKSVPVFERIKIEDEKVIDLIRHLQHEMYMRNGTQPVKVIIGADKYSQLGFELQSELTHWIDMQMDGSKGLKVFGLEIEFNPFIDGLVLTR